MSENTLDFEKVELVRQRMQLTVKDMCALLDVSRATYYKWVEGGPVRKRNEKRVKDVLRQVLPLLRANKWPTEATAHLSGSERVSALLELLGRTE